MHKLCLEKGGSGTKKKNMKCELSSFFHGVSIEICAINNGRFNFMFIALFVYETNAGFYGELIKGYKRRLAHVHWLLKPVYGKR